jgi:hypothetical protein
MPRKIWITRDSKRLSCATNDSVELYRIKPDNYNGYFTHDEGAIYDFCYEDFVRFTGYKIIKGECKRIEIHIKEVEPNAKKP